MHGQCGFMNEISRMGSQNMCAENSIGLCLSNHFHETLNISRRLRLA